MLKRLRKFGGQIQVWKGKMVKKLKKFGGQVDLLEPNYPEVDNIGVPLEESPESHNQFLVCPDKKENESPTLSTKLF